MTEKTSRLNSLPSLDLKLIHVKIISMWSNQLDISKKIEWLSKIVWWWNWEENDVIEKIIGDWK